MMATLANQVIKPGKGFKAPKKYECIVIELQGVLQILNFVFSQHVLKMVVCE